MRGFITAGQWIKAGGGQSSTRKASELGSPGDGWGSNNKKPRTNASHFPHPPRPVPPPVRRPPPAPPANISLLLPPAPPPPDIPTPEKLLGITLKGDLLVAAILAGAKGVENRSWVIPPGWYALHLGLGKPSLADESLWRTLWRASPGGSPPLPPGFGVALPPRWGRLGTTRIQLCPRYIW
jgi:hypothetical protein